MSSPSTVQMSDPPGKSIATFAGSNLSLKLRGPSLPSAIKVHAERRSWPRFAAPVMFQVELQRRKDGDSSEADLVLPLKDLGVTSRMGRCRTLELQLSSPGLSLSARVVAVPRLQAWLAALLVLTAAVLIVSIGVELKDTDLGVLAGAIAGSTLIPFVLSQVLDGRSWRDLLSREYFKRVRLAGPSALVVSAVMLGITAPWLRVENLTDLRLSATGSPVLPGHGTAKFRRSEWQRLWKDLPRPVADKLVDVPVPGSWLKVTHHQVACAPPPKFPSTWFTKQCARAGQDTCSFGERDRDACDIRWPEEPILLNPGGMSKTLARAAPWGRLTVAPERLPKIAGELAETVQLVVANPSAGKPMKIQVGETDPRDAWVSQAHGSTSLLLYFPRGRVPGTELLIDGEATVRCQMPADAAPAESIELFNVRSAVSHLEFSVGQRLSGTSRRASNGGEGLHWGCAEGSSGVQLLSGDMGRVDCPSERHLDLVRVSGGPSRLDALSTNLPSGFVSRWQRVGPGETPTLCFPRNQPPPSGPARIEPPAGGGWELIRSNGGLRLRRVTKVCRFDVNNVPCRPRRPFKGCKFANDSVPGCSEVWVNCSC